jgi:tRNA A37 threonylcarbamoyladenosine synthetase subunit TsaC/SUA5/YrdC
VAGPDDLLRLLDRPRPEALKLARAFWPGPLTLVVPSRVGLAPGVAGPPGAADQQGTLGLRCSPHPVAAELVRLAYGRGLGPITATSFNRTGEAPCATRDEARRASDAEIALVEGPDAGGGAASTVVDLCGEAPRIVRQGAVAARRIHAVLDGSTDCESMGPLEEAMHSALGGNS